MSITDYHPRILSLASGGSSIISTPTHQSRRESHESAYDAHHFTSQQQLKTENTLNQSIKKMWKEIKHAAAEHHKSVNAAYQASYGAGIRVPSTVSN
ncbi:uncharacterized protein K460DRAFT_361681 [Cucurbitaria berberidis CBS 394.84]|uniref:Uncharacterized protein n=1 Tax=Cucurbitaria berberidis CBS 394.84 TaxID=1168544 RepID=A0A9P4LCM5_9PLEO|nr:uncharacterized protein K460DRAFT_361681 [Cucurbitaria berberidis CBS 394.84]KAF1850926.1 hypothetical protein K460DRAFT_361681 [Cucurbitaria berberidis CBS 394.84]